MRRGNGEGSVFKLGGKRRKPWAVRVTAGWTPEGKQKLKYVGYYITKTEAKDALRKYLVDPFNLENKNITLLDVYERWIKTTTLSETTIKNYKSAFKRCKPLHKKPIRDIKVMHIENLWEDVPASVQPMIKNALNHIYNFAEKNEIIDKNIIPLVEVEKRTTIKKKVPFTSDQIKMLMKYNGHFYADTVKILLYTGMRISELFDIETKNVNLEKRYIIGGKKTEAGRDRIIPIHDEIFEVVKKRYNPDNKYLILSPKGRKVDYPNYVNLFWKNLKIKFDITQTPHDTRHTFITYATKQGLERAAIQKIVGHKGVDITDHYTHRSAEELLKEINKLKY